MKKYLLEMSDPSCSVVTGFESDLPKDVVWDEFLICLNKIPVDRVVAEVNFCGQRFFLETCGVSYYLFELEEYWQYHKNNWRYNGLEEKVHFDYNGEKS